MKLRKKQVRWSRGSFSERREVWNRVGNFNLLEAVQEKNCWFLMWSCRLACVCMFEDHLQAAGVGGQRQDTSSPPTFVKYFVLFFVLFRSVPGEPDAGLTHFLSTPRLHARPHIFPAPSAPPQRNRSGQKNKKKKNSPTSHRRSANR